MRIGIIGGGISGISSARMLKDKGYEVTLFEKKSSLGGLISCSEVEGNLFHKVGGHVFNSKSEQVLEWFWSFFDKEKEFIKAKRNSVIFMKNKFIPYPIENHLKFLPKEKSRLIIEELISQKKNLENLEITNLEEFFINKFGETLSRLYFIPYNQKIWKTPLSEISIDWLEGKLPMPSISNIFFNNINLINEKEMVHSTFFYPKKGGSQFIVERLSSGLKVINTEVKKIIKKNGQILINNEYKFDYLIFTGNIINLLDIYESDFSYKNDLVKDISSLKCTGTKTILCSCDSNPYSWVYLPEANIIPHRIIMTGNFSKNNNSSFLEDKRISCTLETSFVGSYPNDLEIDFNNLPFNIIPLSTNIEANSYVIHTKKTQDLIDKTTAFFKKHNIFCCGRFAQWQYFNMDMAILSAIKISKEISNINF